MREFEYFVLDVFTNEPFSGNPLAVFPTGSGLSSSEMQSIASEFNLSETVFVLESDLALRRLRIFTPSQELPLAGHPVVGTWHLLAKLGVVPATENGVVEIEHELSIGVLPVSLQFLDSKVSRVEMKQGEFEAVDEIEEESRKQELAAALGVSISDIGNSKTSICQVVSTGIRSIAVPVSSLEVLKNCSVDANRLSKFYLPFGAVGCYVFCFETFEPESLVHARFFAPADNIPEDPATGSAAGALSGYLVHNDIVKEREFTIEQGDIMGRPGRIEASVRGSKGNVESVRIGGNAVTIMHGTLQLK